MPNLPEGTGVGEGVGVGEGGGRTPDNTNEINEYGEL